MDTDTSIECKICKQKKPHYELYIANECYECWEADINEIKVKELRKELSQWLDIDKAKIKESLSLNQLEKVRKIIKDNYVEGSDTIGGVASERGGKELIKAMWTTGMKNGWQPSACLKKIDAEIEKLKPKPSPSPELETYTLNCPFCNKEFSCELEGGTASLRGAREELNEKKAKHIREVHGEEESEGDSDETSEIRQKIEPVDSNASQKSSENKPPWPLIITGVFLASSLLVVGIFLVKRNHSRTKK